MRGGQAGEEGGERGRKQLANPPNHPITTNHHPTPARRAGIPAQRAKKKKLAWRPSLTEAGGAATKEESNP
jgi:hypothetical protein